MLLLSFREWFFVNKFPFLQHPRTRSQSGNSYWSRRGLALFLSPVPLHPLHDYPCIQNLNRIRDSHYNAYILHHLLRYWLVFFADSCSLLSPYPFFHIGIYAYNTSIHPLGPKAALTYVRLSSNSFSEIRLADRDLAPEYTSRGSEMRESQAFR